SSSVPSVVELFSSARDDDIVSARIDLKLLQRPWRRTADVLSAQVVMTVVTRTPNLFGVVAILNNAFQMSAGRREGFQFSRGGLYQDARLVAELENLA